MSDLVKWAARNIIKWPEGTSLVAVEKDYSGWHPVNDSADIKERGDSHVLVRCKWQAERRRIQGKPSWRDAPEWANWVAQDASGLWGWHESKPDPDHQLWTCTGGSADFAGEGVVLGDWRDTLEQRPESKPDQEIPSPGPVILTNGFAPVRKSQESSGGDNDYWIAEIKHPKRLEPCAVECEDLIEHFQMSFQEGEAFKALWRNGMLRLGKGKPGDTHLRNAEKVAHFGARMVAIEKGKESGQ